MRDRRLLKKIIAYCQRIEANLDRFDHSYDAFISDVMFQDACCMCVIQIGELVGSLSDSAKSLYPSIPWRAIKDTRNFYVHAYGSVDLPSVWETLLHDLPALKSACVGILETLSR